MWCLLRLLPLIIGDLVPEDCKYWLNFLKLLKIVDIIFALETTNGLAGYLAELIEDHHTTLTQLYARPVTPKFHYMLHMPQWIIQ